MSKEFRKLVELEKERLITIGIDRSHANNFWANTTKLGKVLNYLTIVFIIMGIIVFIKIGIKEGLLAMIFTIIYSFGIQKVSSSYARNKLLKNEDMFIEAYEMSSITVRNNISQEITSFPNSWKQLIISFKK